MSDLRIFVSATPEFIARLDAYCDTVGMTRSGAIRAALDKAMAGVSKGIVPMPAWGNMSSDMKASAICLEKMDIDAVAKKYNVARETVERFAYRNNLIGPGSLTAAE